MGIVQHPGLDSRQEKTERLEQISGPHLGRAAQKMIEIAIGGSETTGPVPHRPRKPGDLPSDRYQNHLATEMAAALPQKPGALKAMEIAVGHRLHGRAAPKATTRAARRPLENDERLLCTLMVRVLPPEHDVRPMAIVTK